MRRMMILLFVLLPFGLVAAQGTGETAPAGEISIFSPPPVSLLHGTVSILGTVNVPSGASYFVQVRPLDDTLFPVGGDRALWSPATLPSRAIVTNDVLGEWDTTLVPDGVYQLELIVTLANGQQVRTGVSPLRVMNEPSPFSGARFIGFGDFIPPNLATAPPVLLPPTVQPGGNAPTPAPVGNVTVTATIQANIRMGDSTTYPALDFLNVGESLTATGRSNRSSWIQVQLPNGDLGFISPSVVQIQGDLSSLSFVTPPPLPFTPTPVPTATPVAVANLVFDSFRTEPSQPVCNETYTLYATVRNAGTGTTGNSAAVNILDVHVGTNTVSGATVGAIPPLNPGETFEIEVFLTVSTFYEETHRVTLMADSGNAILETNENDNALSFDYTLEQGDCG